MQKLSHGFLVFCYFLVLSCMLIFDLHLPSMSFPLYAYGHYLEELRRPNKGSDIFVIPFNNSLIKVQLFNLCFCYFWNLSHLTSEFAQVLLLIKASHCLAFLHVPQVVVFSSMSCMHFYIFHEMLILKHFREGCSRVVRT